MGVEPIPGEPAAVVEAAGERALAVADYHAGYEAWLRHEEGVNAESQADTRRETVLELVDDAGVDRVAFLGDLAHFFGGPHGAERGEIEVLFEQLPVPVTVVKGNHDGGIESIAGPEVTVTDAEGTTMAAIAGADGVDDAGGKGADDAGADGADDAGGDPGDESADVGFVHGHGWPSRDVLACDVVCMGHEHPCVRLEDPVGGHRVDRAWLRGPLDPRPFERRYDDLSWTDPELVVFPRFNDLLGCTWVNEDPEFLAPFLPDGLPEGDVYLLDGTRLGTYEQL